MGSPIPPARNPLARMALVAVRLSSPGRSPSLISPPALCLPLPDVLTPEELAEVNHDLLVPQARPVRFGDFFPRAAAPRAERAVVRAPKFGWEGMRLSPVVQAVCDPTAQSDPDLADLSRHLLVELLRRLIESDQEALSRQTIGLLDLSLDVETKLRRSRIRSIRRAFQALAGPYKNRTALALRDVGAIVGADQVQESMQRLLEWLTAWHMHRDRSAVPNVEARCTSK